MTLLPREPVSNDSRGAANSLCVPTITYEPSRVASVVSRSAHSLDLSRKASAAEVINPPRSVMNLPRISCWS
jgi:hypothetical protein